ncbi:MAG: YwaF family protein [Lachnospiraceae bacterium]|jgi:uncharacterized membrane protein YwaF|nr:YwaF family protein [Lachnospiraceae bacterium]
MFRWFWTIQGDLPDGLGFGKFTPAHFAMLALCTLAVILLRRRFLSLPEAGRTHMLRVLASTAGFMEAGKILVLCVLGKMSTGYLPLHFCSFSLYAALLHAYQPDHGSRFARLLGETFFVLLLPGAAAALLFPDWSFYPVLNFMCLYSFSWHTLVVCYPILLLAGGRIRPSIRHIYAPMLFLAVLLPLILLFNLRFGTNYFFIMWPLKGTPFETMYRLFGGPVGWRVCYAVTVLLVVCAMYAALAAGTKIRSAVRRRGLP